MAMKKYAEGEGKVEVLRGHEAQALSSFESKTGKTLSELNDDERKELHKLLDEASKRNADDEKAAIQEATRSAEPNDSNADDSGSAN